MKIYCLNTKPFEFYFNPIASFDSQVVCERCLEADWKVAEGTLLVICLN